MTATFFDNFPTIKYIDRTATNILVRTAIAREVLTNIDAFYPYVIKEDLRPDQVADYYYGDPNFAWLVWLSNDTIDPFFQWPLTDAQLNRIMVKKYGTLQNAQSTIIHYKNDQFDYVMSPTTYAYTSPDDLTDWTPVYAYDHEVDVNEQRRTIQLVSVKYLPQIVRELQTVFSVESKRV